MNLNVQDRWQGAVWNWEFFSTYSFVYRLIEAARGFAWGMNKIHRFNEALKIWMERHSTTKEG